jgi:hypothetical protein
MALIDDTAAFAGWLDARIDKFNAQIAAGRSCSDTRALLKADCAEARAIRDAFRSLVIEALSPQEQARFSQLVAAVATAGYH